MENISKISRTFLYVAFLFFILWLGGYIARQIYIFQLFEPEELSLRDFFINKNLSGVFYSFIGLLLYNIISFLVFILFFSLFLLTSKINLKQEGWLLITVIIVFLTAPLEIFLLTFDFNIVSRLLSAAFSNYTILTLLRERMTILGSFPLAEIFAYIFITYLILFRPFRLKPNEN